MKLLEARQLIKQTFENPFSREHFALFIKNLFKDIDETTAFKGTPIPDSFKDYITSYERLCKVEDDTGNIIDVLLVKLKRERSIEYARNAQRNFIRRYLNGSRGGELKDAALVAFYTDSAEDWRFSLIKMQYSLEKKKDDLTPAKRFSFLVGKNERSHTAQKQLAELLTLSSAPALAQIESAFNIETVTKEFFEKYKELFLRVSEHLESQFERNRELRKDLEAKHIDHISFTKKLLGQIVFLYFLQKKGWLGVPKNETWGKGDRRYLKTLLERTIAEKKNFFTDYLQYLFYEALAEERRGSVDPSYYKYLDCKIPFLNGGLFEADYDWQNISIKLPNDFFTNENSTKEGDIGDGILDVFDRYNFTVKEDEPLDKEVAVDPEMLGKVFENLLEVKDRKSKGAFYTPREIVHYMCQESLINYLDNCLSGDSPDSGDEMDEPEIETDLFGAVPNQQLKIPTGKKKNPKIIQSHKSQSRQDIEKFIREGTSAIDNDLRVEKAGRETETYSYQLPESIRERAVEIDKALANIRVCDPAIGSGAFPVGMMNEIVKAREILTTYLPANKQKDHTPYELKRHCIQECIYGVDIDHSAIDVAKLRLWLSLVVDEEDFYMIKPLPNLDYKIVEGNSLVGMPYEPQSSHKLEELRKKFFDLTDLREKEKYRKLIDTEVQKLLQVGSKYLGYEITFDFKLFFSEVFHEKKGFDVVIGNPPYVGQKGHKELFQVIKNSPLGKKFHQRRMDLFYFFFHFGLLNLKEGGVLTFISTNYYLTATYSDKLRKHIFEDASILGLINFNELKVFESATGQHNLITTLRKGKNPKVIAFTATTKRTGLASDSVLRDILNRADAETDYYIQSQDLIFEKGTLYIRIEPHHNSDSDNRTTQSGGIFSILNKMKANNRLLNEYCFIEQGIVSGSDKVSDSLIKKYPSLQIQKGEGIYILTNREIKAMNFSESDRAYLKKTYKNSDLKKWVFFPDNSLNVLYIKSTGKYFAISKGVKNHLDRFKLILINRNVRVGSITEKDYQKFIDGKIEISYIMNASSMKDGNYYCLSYARGGKNTFEVPKIVNSRRAYSNVFALEDRGYYEQSDIVVTTLKPLYKDKISLLFILGILNSKLLYHWFYHKGKRKGEALELFQKPISEVPLKFVETDLQAPIVKAVQKIIALKKSNPQANTTTSEHQIDIMVYHLYNLTFKEAKIIDPELSEEEFKKYELK